jgi:CO/xanthine dehydrogenase Mo-binding subunit
LRGEIESTWTPEKTADEHFMLAKLTGQQKYTDDLSFQGMLYGLTLRSPLPHARVIKVDTDEAEHMPGVVRVLTAKDVPGQNHYGLLTRDQPIFCDEEVLFTGDCLALVVAQTLENAQAALKKIHVQLEPLPVLTDPEAALQPDAPVLHEYLKEQHPDTPNVLWHHKVRKGDIEAGFAQADIILEGDYSTPFIDHAYMELECSIGVRDNEEEISVYCGSQGPMSDREQVSEALGIPLEKVRIAHQYVGGGFGGKEDVAGQVLAAIAAWVTRKPVKVLFTREESLLAHHKRHAEKLHYKVGATRDGKLVASEVKVIGDTGAYASTGEAVLFRSAVFACGPYVVPNVKVDTYAVHTNNPTCGAFRGFGGTQVAFASETHLQKLIDALGMDPFEFRLKNALELGKATITGHILDEEVGAGYKACLLAVKDALDKTDRPELLPNEKLGIGVAGAYKNVGLGSGIPDGAGARVILQRDGTFLVRHGASDIGQGSEEAMATITARTLGVPLRLIRVHTGDTKFDPLGGMTTASRATFVSGNATLLAAKEMHTKLWNAVSSEFNVPPEALEISNGQFVNQNTGEVYISLKELANSLDEFDVTANFDAPVTNRVPEYVESYPNPKTSDHRLHFAYDYGVQAAMVAVNEITGAVRVIKIIAAHDIGKSLIWRNCIGQIVGATVQGLGYALSEQLRVSDGQVLTRKFGDVGLLRLRDIPEIDSILVEEPHPHGPYGAKGMGELAISPTAPAVINAIHNAVGIWISDLPATQDKILAAISAKKNGN